MHRIARSTNALTARQILQTSASRHARTSQAALQTRSYGTNTRHPVLQGSSIQRSRNAARRSRSLRRSPVSGPQARQLSMIKTPLSIARGFAVLTAMGAVVLAAISQKIDETKSKIDEIYSSASEIASGALGTVSTYWDSVGSFFHHREEDAKQSDPATSGSGSPPSKPSKPSSPSPSALDPMSGKYQIQVFPELAKKLVTIRNALKEVRGSQSIELPSIVVIGSQSAGKSSVLELIVGQEFLPKGDNMVTRRPLEITLIQTEPGSKTVADVNGALFSDFRAVASTLSTLNASVSHISSSPIDLKIYSANVPDLTLIDLPGFIRVPSVDQPAELKRQINEVCHKYIARKNNVILAVCSSDVDLANADALRASREVDPQGLRTVGVLTKADLVEGDRLSSLLQGRDYPLKLGYFALNCHSPDGQVNSTSGPQIGLSPLVEGIQAQLTTQLANGASSYLATLRAELEEARYAFKVEYADRFISASSYTDDILDRLRNEISTSRRRTQSKKELTSKVLDSLEPAVLDIAKDVWWNDEKWVQAGEQSWGHFVKAMAKRLAGYSWEPVVPDYVTKSDVSADLDSKTSRASERLIKNGVGRVCTQTVVSEIETSIYSLLDKQPFCQHPSLRAAVRETIAEILKGDRYRATSERVETALTPYKYDFEVEERDWSNGHTLASNGLEQEMRRTSQRLKGVIEMLGGNKAAKDVLVNSKGHSEQAIALAKEAESLRQTTRALKRRIKATKGSCFKLPEDIQKEPQTLGLSTSTSSYMPSGLRGSFGVSQDADSNSSSTNSTGDSSVHPSIKAARYCPEQFLTCLAAQLAQTSVLFIQNDLVRDFNDEFPRALRQKLFKPTAEDSLGDGTFVDTHASVTRFANENPAISRQLRTQKKLAALQRATDELVDAVRYIDQEKKARNLPRSPGS